MSELEARLEKAGATEADLNEVRLSETALRDRLAGLEDELASTRAQLVKATAELVAVKSEHERLWSTASCATPGLVLKAMEEVAAELKDRMGREGALEEEAVQLRADVSRLEAELAAARAEPVPRGSAVCWWCCPS